jgi:hypothetical protein
MPSPLSPSNVAVLTAHPIDIVATFAAQRPRPCRQGVRVRLFAVVLVRAAIEQLLTRMMEMRADPGTGGKLASAEFGASHAVDLTSTAR